jgi:hypothetical protein
VGDEPPAPKETRADRIRRRVSDHPLGAVVVLAVGVIGAVGGTIGGAREIADLFDGSGGRPTTTTTAVRLNRAELRTAKNDRYGFSFQYPVTWQRADPVNGDGLRAIGPAPGLEVLAYGRLPTVGPSPQDPFDRLEYQVRQLASTGGTEIVEDPNQQNVTRIEPGGDTGEVAGSRFVMATPGAPAVTTVALVTTTPERDVEMLCKVPSPIAARWRGACNELLSTLTLTR